MIKFSSCRIIILSLIVALSLSSCTKNYADPCSNCFQDKPTQGILLVNVNPSDHKQLIEVRIIMGKLEKGIEYIRDTLPQNNKEYWVEVNHYYTVEAHYLVDGKHILAIDGDRVSIQLDEENCDEPCWRPHDGSVDCRL
ncbi:MAG: hypothetical protein J7L96_06970 [Bacteroidales bacterium]|nr:hypothetical protein [Bacteroidales bacterium]